MAGREKDGPQMRAKKVTIKTLGVLFRFQSFGDWEATATMRFRNCGHTADTVIAVDREGMVCVRQPHFKDAKYPVTVYAIDVRITNARHRCGSL